MRTAKELAAYVLFLGVMLVWLAGCEPTSRSADAAPDTTEQASEEEELPASARAAKTEVMPPYRCLETDLFPINREGRCQISNGQHLIKLRERDGYAAIEVRGTGQADDQRCTMTPCNDRDRFMTTLDYWGWYVDRIGQWAADHRALEERERQQREWERRREAIRREFQEIPPTP